MKKFVLALAVGGVMSGLGCNTKTRKHAYEEARPAAEPLRAKVVAAAELVAKLPPPASGTTTCKPTATLTFDPKSDAHDTDYLMFEEARRGAAKRDDKQPDEDLDLHFPTNPLATLLRGTNVNSIYTYYSSSDYANDELNDSIRRGLNVKHLVLVHARGTTLDYFLIDLTAAAPTVTCAGSFDATADPSLGTHTDDYDTVTRNKRTGAELKRVEHRDTHDDRKSALYDSAVAQLTAHAKTELGLNGIEPAR